MTSRNSLVVGALIEKNDFFSAVPAGVQCELGHSPSAGEAYCPRCGGRFAERQKEVLTDLGKRFVERFRLTRPHWPVGREPAYELESSGYFHHVRDGEWGSTRLAVVGEAVRVEEAKRVSRKTVCYVAFEEIPETTAGVRSLLAELGLGDRDVRVYWF